MRTEGRKMDSVSPLRWLARTGSRFWVAAVLVSFAPTWQGCDSQEDKGDATDVTGLDALADTSPGYQFQADELDANTVVFATGSGGGFLTSPQEVFFNQHHAWATYVFGDGRFVHHLGPVPAQNQNYWVWREGHIPAEAFQALLDKANLLVPEDGRYYETCPAVDAGSQSFRVELPGLKFSANASTAFAPDDLDCGEASGEGPLPRPELVQLLEAIHEATREGAAELVTDGLLLGGYVVNESPCGESDPLNWPFPEVELPPGDASYLFALPLSGQMATDVRAFVREQLVASAQPYDPIIRVQQGETCFVVFYDDVLPNDESLPYYRSPTEER